MTVIQDEILLFIGIAIFYIYDSALLLYTEELVLELELTGKRWILRTGSDSLYSGRHLYIPNPITPSNLVFVISLPLQATRANDSQNNFRHYKYALVPLQITTNILLLLFAVALPSIVFIYGTGFPLLIWFMVVYAVIIYNLFYMYRHRNVLELSKKKLASITWECLSCSPFAINIVRKITLCKKTGSDPMQFARKEVDVPCFNRLAETSIDRLNLILEGMVMDDKHFNYISLYRDSIPRMK